jgi:hypothetical protein
MAYAYPGDGAPDYFPCRYGTSKLLFRGPRRTLDPPYVTTLGGTATYGKFVSDPYPALVEAATGLQIVNLGCINAGLDVFLNDPSVLGLAAKARISVVQITGAPNLTNRFYTVHPRRNDRFLTAQPPLKALFRDVDFTELHFTRHMLNTLKAAAPDRFEMVAEELRRTWVVRMKALLEALSGRVLLLWIADRPPLPRTAQPDLDTDPVLVDCDMIAEVRPMAWDFLAVVSSPEALASGVQGMAYGPMEGPAARLVPGPAIHHEVAAALAPRLLQVL